MTSYVADLIVPPGNAFVEVLAPIAIGILGILAIAALLWGVSALVFLIIDPVPLRPRLKTTIEHGGIAAELARRAADERGSAR